MRFSLNTQDTGYQNYQALKSAGVRIDIFVDGEAVGDVFEADDLAGYVRRNSRDEQGQQKQDGEIIRGKVEIRISLPEPVEADADGK